MKIASTRVNHSSFCGCRCGNTLGHTMQFKGVLNGRQHRVFVRTPIEGFGGIIVGIQGRIGDPQVDNGKGCQMHASGCKDQCIELGHSGIGRAFRITMGCGVVMCVHVRDGAGKHILMDLKGDGILILIQHVNGRNVAVFGSAIYGNQLNVFRAFVFKDLNGTCLWTRTKVLTKVLTKDRSCLWTRTKVLIATVYNTSRCGSGAHRGRGC
jgi:hypothetical protein